MLNAIMGIVANKFLEKGLSAAFGEGTTSGPVGSQITPPSFSPARVFASSPAGDADDASFVDLYDSADFDDNLLEWEKRLTNYVKDDIVISKV